jgi:hypothetical protein
MTENIVQSCVGKQEQENKDGKEKKMEALYPSVYTTQIVRQKKEEIVVVGVVDNEGYLKDEQKKESGGISSPSLHLNIFHYIIVY